MPGTWSWLGRRLPERNGMLATRRAPAAGALRHGVRTSRLIRLAGVIEERIRGNVIGFFLPGVFRPCRDLAGLLELLQALNYLVNTSSRGGRGALRFLYTGLLTCTAEREQCQAEAAGLETGVTESERHGANERRRARSCRNDLCGGVSYPCGRGPRARAVVRCPRVERKTGEPRRVQRLARHSPVLGAVVTHLQP